MAKNKDFRPFARKHCIGAQAHRILLPAHTKSICRCRGFQNGGPAQWGDELEGNVEESAEHRQIAIAVDILGNLW